MGLDQYAYAENGEEQEELAYWRKHNRLQGWMEELWNDKGRPNAPEETSPMGDFNCIPVELTLSDLEQLEAHVVNSCPKQVDSFLGTIPLVGMMKMESHLKREITFINQLT